MPIYEYICSGCSAKFELLRHFSQADEAAECPNCKSFAQRVVSKCAVFAKNESGVTAPVAGTSSCASCGSSSCTTCGH